MFNKMPKTVVLSLGGSLIIPDNIDINFLKDFKSIIEKYIKTGFKFIIICGGGKLARDMQQAASKLADIDNEALDWLGIYATRLNAQLIKTIFKNNAEDAVSDNPNEKINFKKSILVASGWLPGWSTDYDAILLAKNLGVKEIINLSNVEYVCDKDPKEYKDAKKIERMGWSDYQKLISDKWRAGMNAPFYPLAAKEAQKSGIKVSIMGKDLRNFENMLKGKKFKGTVIE